MTTKDNQSAIDNWQARHISQVIAFFYFGSGLSREAQVFGPVYGKLAQGLVDRGVLSLYALEDIAAQIPAAEYSQHLFWIARDCMPRSKRPPHYTEENEKVLSHPPSVKRKRRLALRHPS